MGSLFKQSILSISFRLTSWYKLNFRLNFFSWAKQYILWNYVMKNSIVMVKIITSSPYNMRKYDIFTTHQGWGAIMKVVIYLNTRWIKTVKGFKFITGLDEGYNGTKWLVSVV